MIPTCPVCGRPKLADVYSCAGGAGMGYDRAGFCVTGIDDKPQPNYPFHFIQADALDYLADSAHLYAAIHTSPPCQANTPLTKGNRKREGWTDDHEDMIPETRELLDAWGGLYVIENTAGATLRKDLTLCGEMFGLAVIRHRFFELGNWWANQPRHKPHRGRVTGWRHGIWYPGPYFAVYGDGGGKGTVAEWQNAMGIDWTDDRKELAEAIPPAYTELIGSMLLEVINDETENVA